MKRRRYTREKAKNRKRKDELARKFKRYMKDPTPWKGMCCLAAWTDAPGGKRQLVHVGAGERELRRIYLIHEHPVVDGMLILPGDPYRYLTPSAEFVVIRARKLSMLPFEYVGPMCELDLSAPVLFEDILITHPEIWEEGGA